MLNPFLVKAEAERIRRDVREGRLDPRPAAAALGLEFDQDIIMAIIEKAAEYVTAANIFPAK